MPTLLIADEKPHAERLKEVLEQQGFTCSTASKAGEAVKLLTQQQPDLFLLDPHLNLGGPVYFEHLELIQEARSVSPKTKICVLCADPGTLSEARTLGADAYFEKIGPIAEVIETLKALATH